MLKHIPSTGSHFLGPDPCGSFGWASSCKAKGLRFYSRSGHMPGLQVRSSVAEHMRGNGSMFLSHVDVSLLLFLPPSPSLELHDAQ